MKEDSIAKITYDAYVANPLTTATKICKEYKLVYKDNQNYINKLLSQYRSYHRFASPRKAHLPKKRIFEWENIPRTILPGRGLLAKRLKFWGWKPVEGNRNDFWIFKDKNSRGSVHWYGGGLVRLYLQGEVQVARCKELFCRAFRWFSPEQIHKYLDVPLKEVSKKWTFDLDAPVPIFDIRQFERSHGIIIHTDLSDPKSIHVTESTPFWIGAQERATANLAGVVDQLGVEIKEHLKLIQLAQDVAKQQLKKPDESFWKRLLRKWRQPK